MQLGKHKTVDANAATVVAWSTYRADAGLTGGVKQLFRPSP